MSKITIITSVYNGGKHIKGFLENIVRQTIFDECELFLLDANSPDNEYEVIKEYQKKFSNIKYETKQICYFGQISKWIFHSRNCD